MLNNWRMSNAERVGVGKTAQLIFFSSEIYSLHVDGGRMYQLFPRRTICQYLTESRKEDQETMSISVVK